MPGGVRGSGGQAPTAREEPGARQFGQLVRIDRIGFGPGRPDQFHLRGVDHDGRVAGGGQLPLEPPAVERGLEDDGQGRA
jgi:hypothetical protein